MLGPPPFSHLLPQMHVICTFVLCLRHRCWTWPSPAWPEGFSRSKFKTLLWLGLSNIESLVLTEDLSAHWVRSQKMNVSFHSLTWWWFQINLQWFPCKSFSASSLLSSGSELWESCQTVRGVFKMLLCRQRHSLQAFIKYFFYDLGLSGLCLSMTNPSIKFSKILLS